MSNERPPPASKDEIERLRADRVNDPAPSPNPQPCRPETEAEKQQRREDFDATWEHMRQREARINEMIKQFHDAEQDLKKNWGHTR